MTDLINLEDHAIAAGFDLSKLDPTGYSCAGCGKKLPAFAIVPDDSGEKGFCACCIIDAHREITAQTERADAEARAVANPWDSPLGEHVRAERNLRIDRWRWAIDPGCSPLSVECQEEVRGMIRTLHRITLDFNSPEDVVWPDEPVLNY